MRTDEMLAVEELSDTIRRKDAEIAALRAALVEIGDLAAKSVDDEFIRGVALRDIIFRCADAIAPEQGVSEQKADET